jgi:hypothetical protein
MKHISNTFSSCEVELDSNEFENCRFDNCILIYRGGTPPSIVGCSFGQFQIRFADSAGNTLLFLKILFESGSGFREIVESTFKGIRGDDDILNSGVIH